MLRAQVRGVLVDAVIELTRDFLDALARFETNHRAAAQGSGHGGLRDPREKRDVE